jgi:hypothetical protein
MLGGRRSVDFISDGGAAEGLAVIEALDSAGYA